MGYLTLRERYLLGELLKKKDCSLEEKQMILVIMHKLREHSITFNCEECNYVKRRLFACMNEACDHSKKYSKNHLQNLIEKVDELQHRNDKQHYSN